MLNPLFNRKTKVLFDQFINQKLLHFINNEILKLRTLSIMNISHSQRFLHETNDSISYREDWLLPSDRINYIKNHQVTIMADLHTNPKMLPPLWTKISKTAWYKSPNIY